MLKLTTLMDNLPSENKALINEHGLSVLVETAHKRLLFDCGASDAAWRNARRMGRNIRGLDAVVISHSHYDHAAGYRDLIESGCGSSVLYTGREFLQAKYAFDGVKYTDLSAGFGEDFLEEHSIEHRVCEESLQIDDGVWLVGHFARRHAFESIPERFVRETPEGMVRDLFEDEICLAAETQQGLVVLVGCSHPGILNMIETVHERLDRPVYAVFGGTHLMEADEARIGRTVRTLKQMGLRILGLGHCSGTLAECLTAGDPDVQSCHMAVGDCIWFDQSI